MGPLKLADFIGIDVMIEVMESLYQETADSKYRPRPPVQGPLPRRPPGPEERQGFLRLHQEVSAFCPYNPKKSLPPPLPGAAVFSLPCPFTDRHLAIVSDGSGGYSGKAILPTKLERCTEYALCRLPLRSWMIIVRGGSTSCCRPLIACLQRRAGLRAAARMRRSFYR